MVLHSVTRTISIDAPVAKVFTFLSNLANWPKWAVTTIVGVKPGSEDWWALETRTGLGRLRIQPNEALGILDHELVALGVKWTIPARVVSNGDGSEFMLTYFQPASLPKEAFDKQMSQVEKDLAKLKELMEA